MKTVGVCSIATGTYLEYWHKQLNSWLLSNPNLDHVTFHLFTDRHLDAEEIKRIYSFLEIRIYRISSMKFPEASVMRYNVLSQNLEDIEQDLILFIDADMEIVSEIRFEDIYKKRYGISLVRHPGFFREVSRNTAKYYFSNYKRFIKDLVNIFKFGRLGTWEKNSTSSAYVKRRMRKEYVCGGVWFGRQIEFRDIVKKIENLRFRDLDIRLGLPIWHDESYLNKWASENNFNLLSSSFCFNTEYPWIKHLKPVIIAVDKHSQLLN